MLGVYHPERLVVLDSCGLRRVQLSVLVGGVRRHLGSNVLAEATRDAIGILE